MTGARWKAVLSEFQGNDEALAAAAQAQQVDGEITRDLALAYTALARATAARLSAEAASDESSGRHERPRARRTTLARDWQERRLT